MQALSPQQDRRDCPSRAQSEVTGVALLTGVVTIVALLVGGVIIAESGPDDDGPTTGFEISASTENVTLAHNGGDTVAVSNLRVTLRQGNGERTFVPAVGNTTDGDGTLRPGDAIRREHGFPTGDLQVIVVHDPSNEVLADERVTIPAYRPTTA